MFVAIKGDGKNVAIGLIENKITVESNMKILYKLE